MSDETSKKDTKQKFWTRLNELKMIAGGLVLLPFFGSQIGSLVDWGSTVYNINDKFNHIEKIYATKEDSVSAALDVLLFIEPAIRNDITSLQFTIDTMVKQATLSNEEETVLLELRAQYKSKILELNRIRQRIKSYDPTWKPVNEETQ